MDWLINTVGKVAGVQKFLDLIDGYKTYIAGITTILTGLTQVLTGLIGLFSEIGPLHGLGDYYGWSKGLGHDANATALLTGFAAVGMGLGMIGLRHAHSKAADPAPAPVQPAAAP